MLHIPCQNNTHYGNYGRSFPATDNLAEQTGKISQQKYWISYKNKVSLQKIFKPYKPYCIYEFPGRENPARWRHQGGKHS